MTAIIFAVQRIEFSLAYNSCLNVVDVNTLRPQSTDINNQKLLVRAWMVKTADETRVLEG